VARTKEFDREQALDRAMHVFWSKGYAATSLDDLLDGMGIGRQSMYDTFGSKRELFEAALERYLDKQEPEYSCLATAPSPLRAIRDAFEGIVDMTVEEQRKGCFGINSTIELVPHDEHIARMVVARHRRTEDEIYAALERAKELGELARSKDSRGLARFLLAALQGLRVTAVAMPKSAALRDIARFSLQALE